MSVEYRELFVEQGEDFSANIAIPLITNSVANLDNYSVRGAIKKSYWTANTSADIAGTFVLDNNYRKLQISLSSNVTQNLTSNKYVYDLFMTNNISNTHIKILDGIMFVEPSVTKF